MAEQRLRRCPAIQPPLDSGDQYLLSVKIEAIDPVAQKVTRLLGRLKLGINSKGKWTME